MNTGIVDLNEIILLKRMNAISLTLDPNVSKESVKTIKKCLQIEKFFLKKTQKNKNNNYYNSLYEVPISVEELLMIMSINNGYGKLGEYTRRNPSLNDKNFKKIYNKQKQYLKLNENCNILKIGDINKGLNYVKYPKPINLDDILNMDLSKIILLQKLQAICLTLDSNIEEKSRLTIRKSLDVANNINYYKSYDTKNYIPISVEELLKIMLLNEKYFSLFEYACVCKKINYEPFLEMYYSYEKYLALADEDFKLLEKKVNKTDEIISEYIRMKNIL